MTDILLIGGIPEFAPLAEMLRGSGINVAHRRRIHPGGMCLVARAVVCDARHAVRSLAAARPATRCVAVLDEPCPRSIRRCLDAGFAPCLVRPLPLNLLVRGLSVSLAAAGEPSAARACAGDSF